MKICITQSRSVKGNIPANVQNHIRFIEAADENGADAIFFPELSITGYEPTLAAKLSTSSSDSRFGIFQELSNQHSMVIGVGVPTPAEKGIYISLVVFQPNRAPAVYSKQNLHEDEVPYFVPGTNELMISLKGESIAPAICYESLLPKHSQKAFNAGAQLYMACVAKPLGGVQKAFAHFPLVAKQYDMNVLMANCVGYCDNFDSVGGSSVWNKKGELVAQLDGSHEGFIIFNTETDETLINYLP